MHLIRFKCKVTGRTFQEVKDDLVDCDKCAFQFSKIEVEDDKAHAALCDHCLTTYCIDRCTYFVEVTA